MLIVLIMFGVRRLMFALLALSMFGIYQRLAQLRQSKESGLEHDKPEGKTRPSYRMIGATKARLIVNDLKIAKAVRVGDQVLEIDARSRAIADVLLRRVLGELKVDPLVLPEKENDAQEG